MSHSTHLPPSAQKALVTSAYHLFIHKCYGLAATVMLIYDTFITMDREVNVWWGSRWSGVKVLYFFNRYANIGAYIILEISVDSVWPVDVCRRFVLFPAIFNLVQQLVIGSILILYVYALCGRSKPLISAVILVFIAQIVVNGWSLGAIAAVSLPPPFVGCIVSGKKGTGIRVKTAFIMELVFITVGFGVMFWQAMRLQKHQIYTPMITFVTRDGLKYFAVIFAANFLNAMNFSLVKAKDLQSIHATFSALVTVIMINRLILSLREEGRKSPSQGMSATHTLAVTDTLTGGISFLSRATFVEEHDLRTTQVTQA